MSTSNGETDADPRLGARVRTALGLESGPLTVLEGGRSGLTYALRGPEAGYVVKAVPPGRRATGRHDVLRQAVILDAVAGTGVPVPAVRAVDEEQPAWFAMDLAAGEAVEPVLEPDRAIDPPTARARMLTAARILGELHSVPLGAIERSVAASRPVPEVTTLEAEIGKWARTMDAVPEDLRPQGTELIAELAADIPAAVEPVLVHGDFRLGNVLFDGLVPTALIDWEIWSVGDPRVDLGWFGVFTDGTLFPGAGHAVDGLPAEAELADTYREARGRGSGPTAWFAALSRMKMAAIMGHNLVRHRRGAHHDPVQEQLPPSIAKMIADARALLAGEPR
ncbi:phosphotransferase family protein [Amycolatopsis solani]|uniref:phosphotransferase family protein n=1 Tax=Amycolatopsis solani TaxID=3028615 RepID=UPI0025B0342C|nr:phosphotransferase family protein [Amycolatopsis sp. MEP2-6]